MSWEDIAEHTTEEKKASHSLPSGRWHRACTDRLYQRSLCAGVAGHQRHCVRCHRVSGGAPWRRGGGDGGHRCGLLLPLACSLRRASRLPLATGKDATADFDDVGHSDEARGMMDGSNDTIKIVGTIEGEIPEHMQQQESEDVRTAVSLCRPAPASVIGASACVCAPVL